MDFSYVSDGYNAHLVMLKPVIYRSNKLEITLVINGRFVKNYNIINSIVEAYDTFLPIGKSPVGIFYLEIDPLLVDCNIHPNKVEIKISNENEICNLVKEKIREELKKETLIPERKIDTNIGYKNTTIFENMPSEVIKEPEFKYEPSISSDVEINQEEKIIEKPVERPIEAIKEETLEPKRKLPILEYVGSIFGTYLLFQNSEGMYLIDQHAAAERVNYEKYLKILSNPNQPTTDLLVPIIVSFSKSEALFLENNLDAFDNIGFKLEQIGDLDFAIRMIPLWAKIDNLESIIYDILSKMIDEKKVDVIYFRDHIAKQISCKASIKANHTISRVEVDALISNLNKCDNPFTCPHGRPTIIKIDINELERKFERIQR
jgi:DNA mismatch repair protein MutL